MNTNDQNKACFDILREAWRLPNDPDNKRRGIPDAPPWVRKHLARPSTAAKQQARAYAQTKTEVWHGAGKHVWHWSVSDFLTGTAIATGRSYSKREAIEAARQAREEHKAKLKKS